MKNLKKLGTLLMCTFLLINCNSEEINREEATSISNEEISLRIKTSIIESKALGKTIAVEYKKKNKSSSKSNDVASIVYENKNEINQIIKKNFPEFELVSDASVNEFRTILDLENSSKIINDSELSSKEKEFMNNIVSSSLEGDINKIILASDEFENYLNTSSLSVSELERGKHILNLQKSLFEQFNNGLYSKEDCSVGKGALASAMVGAAYGFVKGCWTGLIFGWNPGSVAAGCLGGMIVGAVEGAVLGAAGSAVACAI